MKILTSIIILASSVSLASGVDIPAEFKALLDRGKLQFEPPRGMVLIKVKEDSLMRFDIAYFDETNNFEIRINVIPLDSINSSEENLGILNLAKQGSFNAIDLKQDLFNADKAGAGEFMFKEVCGRGYKKGSILFLYKNKCASVYVFYLGMDTQNFGQMVADNICN